MPFGALIVDDQEDVRTLMKLIIDAANQGLFVSGTASSGEEAVARIDDVDPDVVVMDEMMPGMSGIDATKKILARRPGQRIVMCSAYLDDDVIARAREAGIDIFVAKGDVGTLGAVLKALQTA